MKFSQTKLSPNFLEWLGGKWFKTTHETIWYVDYSNKNEYRVVPKGFKTDLGTVPCFLVCLISRLDFPIAYSGHDYDYSGRSYYVIQDLQNLSPKMKRWSKYGLIHKIDEETRFYPDRKFADLVLLDTIKLEGLPKWKAKLAHRAVRLFGGSHFTPNY